MHRLINYIDTKAKCRIHGHNELEKIFVRKARGPERIYRNIKYFLEKAAGFLLKLKKLNLKKSKNF